MIRLHDTTSLTVNEQLLDRGVRHAVYLERLKTQQVNQIVRLLRRDVVPDLLAQLERRLANIATRGFDTGPRTTARIRQMLKSIEEIINGGFKATNKQLVLDLGEIAKAESTFQLRMLAKAIPITVDIAEPSLATLRSIVTSRPFQGKILRDWWSGLTRTTQDGVRRAVNQGLVQGEPVRQIVRRVNGPAGVLATTERNAEAIVRTAVNHVVTHARETTYSENSDVIKGVQFVATLDSRTTPICQSLDGQVFPIDSGPRPPQHFNCRSTTIPVVKSFAELGFKAGSLPPATRSSLDGQVPASLTYPQWLRRQTADVQNEALGPARAELFRAGKFNPATAVVNGKPLTLEQLKARDGR